ncbi:MAG: pyridoxal 5'-phosphate synthase [Chitinophagales bacterium]
MEEHFHKNLSHLRRDYAKGDLHKHQIAANPFTQFSQWFQEMQQAGFVEPNAMFVATVNAAGQPSMRTVLLKEFTAEGFVFYTNQHSRKGKDIAENDQVALLFYWDKLEQQIRIEGKASIFPEQKPKHISIPALGAAKLVRGLRRKVKKYTRAKYSKKIICAMPSNFPTKYQNHHTGAAIW